jgi:5-methylcytosine-specific restriction protein B
MVMSMTYQWTRLYPALARRLLDYERRQPELLAILNELAGRGWVPSNAVSALGNEVDPFSFFASFNRGVNARVERRRDILTLIKERFGLSEEVPDHFDGIPVVDAQQSWFLPYPAERQPGDADSLWKIARSAVEASLSSLDPTLFDRCLQVKTVGQAKLTMGLFWLRPTEFLPLDSKTRAHLEKDGVAVPRIIDGAAYKALVATVRNQVSTDFVQLSALAWSGQERPRRYFAGGIKWGDISKRDEFVAGKYWQLGYDRGTANPAGQRCWQRFDQIHLGDWFAIKGLGGRYDLKVHLVGEVKRIDREQGRIELSLLTVPLFEGKAPPPGPGHGGWFDALLEISQPDTVQKIFGTKSARPPDQRTTATSGERPQNLILFGPPGTGKTHALQLILQADFGPLGEQEHDPEPLRERAADLTWFEVTALALKNLGGTATVSELYEHPLVKAKNAVNPRRQLKNGLWATLQEHTVESSQTVQYARRTGPYLFDKDDSGAWRIVGEMPVELQTLAEEIFSPSQTIPAEPRNTFVTFHQSFSYEDFIEGIRPRIVGEDTEEGERLVYRTEPGVLLRAAERALLLSGFEGSLHEFCTLLSSEDRAEYMREAPQYAVAIDEINRGNISRIFGELISLIEPSKRLGAENELIVTLPYSRQRFGVPANLCLFGTMNTADRSIESLDTALRRRFRFQEMQPDYSKLAEVTVEGINVPQILRRINQRLTVLLDRDHQIGHAYLWPLKHVYDQGHPPSMDQLRLLFRDQILPLLQEYFFSDYAKIGLVLGAEFVQSTGSCSFPVGIADELVSDLRERRAYELVDVMKLDAVVFRKLAEE